MTTDSTITPELLDRLLANYSKPEDLTGENGLFKQLKEGLDRARAWGRADRAFRLREGRSRRPGLGQSRNGTSSKTILTKDARSRLPCLAIGPAASSRS
ncbi:hypothetical protein ACVMIH_007511 [Bradyrhizobium sp. USDA 4503]